MNVQVKELREAERFVVTEAVTGSFGAAEVVVLNIGERGVKISHPQPLRIGTRGRLNFRHRNVNAAIPARVVWSHLSKDPNAGGKLVYHTGLHIEAGDTSLSAALHSMLQLGLLRQDLESLDRKRQLAEEREKRIANRPTIKVVPGGDAQKS